MNVTGERLILGALAVGAVGLYVSGAFEPAEVEPFSEASATSLPAAEPEPVVQAPEVPMIPAPPVSEGLFEDRGDWRGQAEVADLDGDGNLDLVASIRRWSSEETAEGLHVWFGDGANGFELGVEGIRRDMGYGGADVEDVNGDGLLDISFSSHDTPPQVFLQQPGRTWKAASSGLISEGVTADTVLADFDGDGAMELATVGMFPGAGGVVLFEADEDIDWELREELLDVEEFGNMGAVTDIEGDGVLEFIAATSQGPRVWSFDGERFVDRSEGLSTLDEGIPETDYIAGSDLEILPWDFDGDGVQELLCAGMIYAGHAPMKLFRLDDEGVWQLWKGDGLPQDEAVWDGKFVQLDDTPEMEIVMACKFGIKILRVTGPGTFEVVGRLEGTEGRALNVTAGDFDHDGLDEVVFIGFGGIRILEPQLQGVTQ